jgi:hypothetical protein
VLGCSERARRPSRFVRLSHVVRPSRFITRQRVRAGLSTLALAILVVCVLIRYQQFTTIKVTFTHGMAHVDQRLLEEWQEQGK